MSMAHVVGQEIAERELAEGKRLVREMFAARRAFGICDYPDDDLHAVWMAKEKEVIAWSGK